MFPELELDDIVEGEAIQEVNKLGKTFLFDYNEGDFVMKDGKLVEVDKVEGLKVWIDKLTRTEKFKFKVHEKAENTEDEFGVSILKLLRGKKYPNVFIESEIKRELTEEIEKHVLVNSVVDFDISIQQTLLTIKFTVVLNDGNSFTQEVVL